MKRVLILVLATIAAVGLLSSFFLTYWEVSALEDLEVEVYDPDLGRHRKGGMSKKDFLKARDDHFAERRGYNPKKLTSPKHRQRAIDRMVRQESEIAARPPTPEKAALTAAWTPIGPAPVPNGQATHGPNLPASGRVTSIAVHPTNPEIVYVENAQSILPKIE